jgi:hypothetical protein
MNREVNFPRCNFSTCSLVLSDKGLEERPYGLRDYRRTFSIGVANALWYHVRDRVARYNRLDLWRRIERGYVFNCKHFR